MFDLTTIREMNEAAATRELAATILTAPQAVSAGLSREERDEFGQLFDSLHSIYRALKAHGIPLHMLRETVLTQGGQLLIALDDRTLPEQRRSPILSNVGGRQDD